jgi:predicted DNA-binding transcriptional regulator AlpA
VSGTSKTRFITLTELCEQLGISKTRYYQLQRKGVFPAPQRAGNRPVFDTEQVQKCHEVIRNRLGVNGEPILFNAKRKQEPVQKRPVCVKGKHDDLIAALASLGLTVTKEQVAVASQSLPNSGSDLDEPALIKAVFLHLKKQGQP